MKTGLFQSCGHCWVFQIFWHIECSTFTASSFRIWNSSTGIPSSPIPSPPLALFIVMLSKAHLTSHSRMSGSRWVITQRQSKCSMRYHLTLVQTAISKHLQKDKSPALAGRRLVPPGKPYSNIKRKKKQWKYRKRLRKKKVGQKEMLLPCGHIGNYNYKSCVD